MAIEQTKNFLQNHSEICVPVVGLITLTNLSCFSGKNEREEQIGASFDGDYPGIGNEGGRANEGHS